MGLIHRRSSTMPNEGRCWMGLWAGEGKDASIASLPMFDAPCAGRSCNMAAITSFETIRRQLEFLADIQRREKK